MKKILFLIIFISISCIGNAQQYNTIIINGENNSKATTRQWYTIDTNNSEKYPIWKTFFSNGVVVYGRGEYLNEYLVNIDTNNSEKYPIWKVYDMSGNLVSVGKGYISSSGLINIDTNNSLKYPIWVTYTPDGRYVSDGKARGY